ncbi:MAG: DUF3578 domain-containing protein [Pseudomonadota bacterium]
MLERVAYDYAYERGKSFTQNKFSNWVRKDLAIEAKKQLLFLPYELRVKASVGAGNWAAVPWLAFFDPIITESATHGFYVVYLVNAQTSEIHLSLNQGTTAVYQEYGEKNGLEVLSRRAIDIRNRVEDFARYFECDKIDLGSSERLPQGYCAGHSFGRCYQAGKIDYDQFSLDLEKMLGAYAALVDRGGTLPSDAMQDEAGVGSIEETRKYVLSRRIERAPSVRPKVFQKRGIKCEACGLDPKSHYGFDGPIKNLPLDVHHAKAISHLAEGETRRYKIPDDFLVLCPTCHRMIHKQKDLADIEKLKNSIQFIFGVRNQKKPF